jgi:hypothetical protein
MIKFNISKEFEDKNLTHVSIGYKVAESVINHPLFGAEILKFNSFTYTKDTPNDVYLRWIYLIEASKIEIDVEPYFYKNQNVIGMTQNNKIFVNLNGAENRMTGDYLENALHEIGHYPFGYGHGNNFPNGLRAKMLGNFADKSKSVPYIFAEIGKKIYKAIL